MKSKKDPNEFLVSISNQFSLSLSLSFSLSLYLPIYLHLHTSLAPFSPFSWFLSNSSLSLSLSSYSVLLFLSLFLFRSPLSPFRVIHLGSFPPFTNSIESRSRVTYEFLKFSMRLIYLRLLLFYQLGLLNYF